MGLEEQDVDPEARGLSGPTLRLLVARCEITYHGRAVTRLGSGDRVVLFKEDGSLCVHADQWYRPLKYVSMNARR
jgi:RecB family endonuclease NucS